MNILHLVQDEKFIDFFASAIELVEGINHRYIVHTIEPDQPLRYIRQVRPFRKVSDSYFPSESMHTDLANCDVLVVHYLTPLGARMINEAPKKVKIVWSGWGGDYYHLLAGGQDALLGTETRHIARKLDLCRAGANPIIHLRLLLRPLRRFYVHHNQLITAIKRVNFFSAPIPEDYLLLKNVLGEHFTASYIQLNYGSLEDTFAIGADGVEGRNILVGNSASLTNNHIEVFHLLMKHDLTGRKIMVPLNYGDSAYREIVLSHGQRIFGANFHPLVNFLPLDEYNKLIATCSCAIINSYRQQALGNIGSILYQGAKLYLSNKNVVSEFLRERNANSFDIEELAIPSKDAFDELNIQQRLENRQVLEGFWGQKIVARNFQKFIETIQNKVIHDQ